MDTLDYQKDKQIKPETSPKAKMSQLWAHYEKTGFFRKDNNGIKSRRQQKKSNTKYEMN